MRLQVRVDSTDAMIRITKTLEKKRARANEAMKESAYTIFDAAIVLCAKRSGAMRKSGSVDEGFAFGQKRYKIEFDGEYAWEHEHWGEDQYLHKTTPGTEPQFLAKALERTGGQPKVSSNIAKAMRRA